MTIKQGDVSPEHLEMLCSVMGWENGNFHKVLDGISELARQNEQLKAAVKWMTYPHYDKYYTSRQYATDVTEYVKGVL